jgi:hypothetical protein
VGLWKVAMLARAQILAGRRGPDDRPTWGKPATIPHPHPQVRIR